MGQVGALFSNASINSKRVNKFKLSKLSKNHFISRLVFADFAGICFISCKLNILRPKLERKTGMVLVRSSNQKIYKISDDHIITKTEATLQKI